MSALARLERQFRESAQLHLDTFATFGEQLVDVSQCLIETVLNEHKILVCGNGGSAADAQHFAAELSGRFDRERPGLPALSLTADTALLTAVSNDYEYAQVFSRQIQALAQAGDVLLVLTTSGQSRSILQAIEAAHERDVRVVAFTGKGGGWVPEQLRSQDFHFCVPHQVTARIQETQMLMLHCLCDAIDCALLGED
jgi:D-sedoheptulose 7-phosphate isomerase